MNPEIKPQAVEPPPTQAQDPILYRLVVGSLAAALLLTVIGGFILSALGVEVPGALIAIGAGCMGALGGLLAPSPVK